MSTAIVWFRRDLRLHDNPALHAALAAHERVVPVFCLDDRLLHGRFASGARTQFMLECLADLNAGLKGVGSALVMRRGRAHEELARVAEQVGASAIHFQRDLTPYARRRGEEVLGRLRDDGIELHAHPGLTAADDVRDIFTQAGKPFSVFSPFHRAWSMRERRAVLPSPAAVPLPDGLDPGRVPALVELGLEQEVEEPMRGGEQAGLERLERFIERDLQGYDDNRDAMGHDRTSRLSPYHHFGCVSPRAEEERVIAAGDGEGPAAFRRQLCWRDFYMHALYHFPGNARQEFQARYRDGSLPYSEDAGRLAAWTDGRTGFPLVDAGMRQLRHEGWMHNRARLVTGSFLTKSLGIDWREGERVFMRYLLCGDEAVNNGNWQWIASVGVDPAPAFRRIFNPARHQERFDQDGAYVRRWVPELRGVPATHLTEPWTMPEALQEEVGCVIGSDYPRPIIDHREAREASLERYREAGAR